LPNLECRSAFRLHSQSQRGLCERVTIFFAAKSADDDEMRLRGEGCSGHPEQREGS
jgi:hypothetical protein